MSCTLCDGNPYNAIWHDCGGCNRLEFCDVCGEHIDSCTCEYCEDCEELIEDCECEEEDENC